MKEYKKIEKKYIYERDKGLCYFCGKELQLKNSTLDHYLPKSKDGPDDTFNLVLCCKKCNKLKKSSVPQDYEQLMLDLFKKAVADKKIIGKNLRMRHEQLQKLVEQANKLESLDEDAVFQGKGYRFYVSNNKIYKLIHIGNINEE